LAKGGCDAVQDTRQAHPVQLAECEGGGHRIRSRRAAERVFLEDGAYSAVRDRPDEHVCSIDDGEGVQMPPAWVIENSRAWSRRRHAAHVSTHDGRQGFVASCGQQVPKAHDSHQSMLAIDDEHVVVER
jgi:hypothetical protein